MDFTAFRFLVVMVGVVNGIAIASMLTAAAHYFQRRSTVSTYWVYTLWVLFQLLNHILLWWTIWTLQVAARMNFFTYLYLVTGPIVLCLATGVLLPSPSEYTTLDTREHFYKSRGVFFTLWIAFLVWSIFNETIFLGGFHKSVWVQVITLVFIFGARLSASPRIQAVAVVAAFLALVTLVGLFATRLGQF